MKFESIREMIAIKIEFSSEEAILYQYWFANRNSRHPMNEENWKKGESIALSLSMQFKNLLK